MPITYVVYTREEIDFIIDKLRINQTPFFEEIIEWTKEINKRFYNGNPTRSAQSLRAKIYHLKGRIGYYEKQTIHNESQTTNIKKSCSIKLDAIIASANSITHAVNTFKKQVSDFVEEFERDREMLRKLTKIRQAVEDIHI